MRRTKLELTWIGKDQEPQLEPRILLEDYGKSYGVQQENLLIHGDNLLALRALDQDYSGMIKCVYIDPPFNTQQAFEYYDDGLEHSIWLSMMRSRLQLIHKLLHPSGSLFIHIDDNELAYLIAITDEIFGRKNRISVITFKQSSVSGPKAVNPGLVTTSSFILYYAKDKARWESNKVYVPVKRDDRYNKYIVNFNEHFSSWRLDNLRNIIAEKYGIKPTQLKAKFGDKLEDVIENFVLEDPRRVVRTARVAPKDINPEARLQLENSRLQPNKVFRSERNNKDDYFFLNGEQLIFYSTKAKEIDGKYITGEPASTIWDDLLSNNLHKEGGVSFPNGKKPEFLIKRILELSTQKGDIVLDSFAGSGTTGAVAHKMGRKWIMIEQGEHCHTHIIPRLRSVIDGEDQSGISKAVNWQGGGGFRYFHLAPSLLKKDKFGNWVISNDYNSAMLAEAMCKHKGFKFKPDESFYWKQGQSTELDFIYTTTQLITRETADQIQSQMTADETLLICCKAYTVNPNDYPQMTFEKIPTSILKRCEFGKDDYSLDIAENPQKHGLNELNSAEQGDGQ
ncbi:site-specific DNA-methyltransferase [Paenibacillus sp. 1001270B_150601_E10]|uniref:site-specific DNA-methyltransferase n=1 Tax=Paenibacillus sp. 1001270B_150601_E10 TaxID=2787079 RepID=UPI00189F3205|nr:site-specific DNA-methyltransferase [Paenibacillus sp. 1001270B_150601_E10]